MTDVAILVVSYQSADEVAGFVKSVSTGLRPDDSASVRVIENAEDPEGAARIAALPGVDELVIAGANLGYGGGMNRLARTVDPAVEWLLICNPDVRFTDGSISELLAAAARHGTAGLFGPQVRAADGVRYPSARRFPSLRTGVGHALFGRLWPSNPWTQRYHFLVDTAAPEQAVDWLSGACLLTRRSAFDSVGGFDEGYFMYFEDVDLAYRLRKAGWGAVYCPDAIVIHSGAHATSGQSERMRRVHHESARRYVHRRYAAWYLAPIRWSLTLGLAVRRELGGGTGITPRGPRAR